MKDDIILIHVGKCSGTYLKMNLEKNNIVHHTVHHANMPYDIASPEPNLLTEQYGTDKFVCTFRHPIDRWISSFNFKYNLTVMKNKLFENWNEEKKGFMKYKTANNLAEQLYDKNGKPNTDAHNFASYGSDHLRFNLHHYLCNFNVNDNVKILRHEHIDDDFYNTFNIKITKMSEYFQPNPKNKDKITMKAYNNLKRFLKEEYELINKFASFGFISEEYRQFCHGLPKFTKIKIN